MVGGLVENKEVDRREQQANHCKTTTLSSTEHLHLFFRCFTSKHKGSEDVVDLESHLSLGHPVDGVEHRYTLVEHLCLVLRKISYLHIVSHLEVTIKGYLVHDTFHECGFSFTVSSHESHFLATFYTQRHIAEHGMLAIVLAHILADNREVATAQTGRKLEVHG